jgi:hypothetical protein
VAEHHKWYAVQYEVEYLDDRLSDNGVFVVYADNEDEAMEIFDRRHSRTLMDRYHEPMAITANAAWPD